MKVTQKRIQKEFLDGINYLFGIFFTKKLKLMFLDEDKTQTNIYQETFEKVYKEPIEIIAKVVDVVEEGERYFENVKVDTKIFIPTKQLIKNKIPCSSLEDLNNIQKAVVEYDGIRYQIKMAKKTTLIDDKMQFLMLYGYTDDIDSIDYGGE